MDSEVLADKVSSQLGNFLKVWNLHRSFDPLKSFDEVTTRSVSEFV